MKDYVVVKTITSFTQTYLVPSETSDGTEKDISNAVQLVVSEKVKEFSQSFVGEQINTFDILSQSQMLELFAEENPHLGDWTDEKKIEFVNDYKETQNETDAGAKI